MAEAISKNAEQLWAKAANEPWLLHREPFQVAPHVYFVGNSWVGAYLIDCGEELVVIDTLVFEDAYQMINAIWKLGFDTSKISHILLTHCHIDHSGGVNQIKSVSGAKIWQSKEDTEFMYHPANQDLDSLFKMADYKADCFFSDEEPLKVGNITIRTKLTPGHTPGTTSFFIEDYDENGNKLVVGLHGGVGPNTLNNAYFEKWGVDKGLRTRFIQDCKDMKGIHVDIALASHPAHGDMFQKLEAEGADWHALIDQGEWGRFLDVRRGFVEALEV